MRTSETVGNVSAALVAAQADSRPVGKSGNNTFDRYTYAKLEDYIAAAHGTLAKHRLCLLVSASSIDAGVRETARGGKEYRAHVSLVGRLIHESGEWIEFAACGEGQDRADKAVYKGITGARKYLLACVLNLATTDDPESDETVGTAAAADKPKPTKKPGPREQLLAAVKAWTGVADEDMPGMMASVKRAAGVTNEKASEADIKTMLAFVEANKGTMFAEVLE